MSLERIALKSAHSALVGTIAILLGVVWTLGRLWDATIWPLIFGGTVILVLTGVSLLGIWTSDKRGQGD